MGSNMHSVSEIEGASPHYDPDWHVCYARREIQSRAHRHRRSASPFGWFFVRFDVHRPIYSLARGHSNPRYFRRDCRPRLRVSVGSDVRCSFYDHDGPWSSIRVCTFRSLTELLGSKRIRTTAYHPSANGLVERFHRHMKAALMAHGNPRWTETLPLVLLGIRTAVKTDLGCCTAELVFGTTLRLPGEFITPISSCEHLDPSNYVHRLKQIMQALHPVVPRVRHRPSHLPLDLTTCTHVFLRRDAVRKPLQPPYDGPFRVISRTDKHFTLDINGRQDTVTVDRLKVAYVNDIPTSCPSPNAAPQHSPRDPVTTSTSIGTSTPSSASQPTPTPTPPDDPPTCLRTRSGRRVHWPKHLIDFVHWLIHWLTVLNDFKN